MYPLGVSSKSTVFARQKDMSVWREGQNVERKMFFFFKCTWISAH